MKQPGHIRIKDNKVYFKPDGLEKPNEKDFYGTRKNKFIFHISYYKKVMAEYEASKRVIEVSNVFWSELTKLWIFTGSHLIKGIKLTKGEVENNQPCEAEIENNVAMIIKIN